jgi:uncharacterized protein (TIGR00251 family)
LNGKDKIYLNIKVQPRARKPGIEKMSSGEYKIRVSAPPSKGEANKEVVETLASHFGLPPSRVRIVRGQKSQRKLVLLEVDNTI